MPINPGLDISGNGNNWTTNNINWFGTGSTFDTMTDVPTLTNATASNFAVFNPLAKRRDVATNVTFANGNLQATFNDAGGNTTQAWGTIYPTAGKYYWEITVANNASNLAIGIGSQPDQEGTANTSVIYVPGGGIFRYGVSQTTAASYTTNDIIGVAYDVDGATVAFYKNNSLQFTVTGLTVIPSGSFNRGSTSDSLIANFGQRGFTYAPPSGFVALNTFNLPTPTIGATATTQAGKYFNPVLYIGNGGTQSITGVGFQPDFTWVKRRDTTSNHLLTDAVRGAGRIVSSNLTNAEVNDSAFFTSFNSDGFSMAGGAGSFNASGGTYVAWNWNAGGSTVTNTSGSISSQVRASTTAGFSIVTYTGTGANATVGHGLGVAPSVVICKNRSGTGGWLTGFTVLGWNKYVVLNTTEAANNATTEWNGAPTSTVFTLGTDTFGNASGANFVAYCFSAVAGYSAFGSYTGNGNLDGPFVFTGFRPKYVMVKLTSASGESWYPLDSSRNTFNPENNWLTANSNEAENGGSSPVTFYDFVSNGFKIRNNGSFVNTNGATYIYMAFAESPFKYANAR